MGAFSYLTPATNAFSLGHVLDKPNGYDIQGTVGFGGKLYTTTTYGGVDWSNGGAGTIGSFDAATNTYQMKHDLAYSYCHPTRAMVVGVDGNLYGEALSYAPYSTVLFAYYPITNTTETKVSYAELELGDMGIPVQRGLLSASNGKIYGSFQKGIFEYDPVADTLRLRAPLQYVVGGTVYPYGLSSPMIEICRKPNYKPRSTTAFTVCAGSFFSYDLHNVNATGVVWRRNGNVVAAQHNQRLEFSAITAADAGTWACTLTNQCGTTEPPPITITVQSGAFTASTIGGDTLLCGTGDSAVLTGNNGGTWSTGATTPTLAITEPGYYYVTNQHACGSSMSNLVHVAHSDSAKVPPAVWDENYQMGRTGTQYICPGAGIVLTGNAAGPWGVFTPGTWSTGETGPSITVQDTGNYYVSIANACNADTTFVLHALPYQPPPLPQVSFYNTPNGQPADAYLCGNDSVFLYTEAQNNYPLFAGNGQYLTNLGGGPGYAQYYRVPAPGTYYLISEGCPGMHDTLAIAIYHADGPPTEAPVILPDAQLLSGCILDTTYLHTTDPLAYWSWYADGTQDRDTSLTHLVDWNVPAYTLTAFNGCGDGPSDVIGIQGMPVPQVGYAEATATTCINHAAFSLTPGTPAGGTYSGAGVAGNTFSPALAGAGTHAITYTYGTGNCTAHATDSITVDLCTGVGETDHADGIQINPNPNNGTFQVRIERSFKVGSLLLYDASGKRVGNAVRLVPCTNTIHQNGLAPGVYQLRLELDGQVEKRSVVIMGR